jgi:glycosyltransferase involved in cell wall biosynthesis
VSRSCKVAIVTAFPADPTAPRGGVEAVSVVLVDALSTFDDLELHVITTDRGRAHAATEMLGRATIHRLPQKAGRVLVDATGPGRRQMRAYLDDLRPDVIHAHDVYGLMVQGMAIPRVLTIHGFIYGDTIVSAGWLARPRSWLWKRVETRAWADHPHIISISPYVRERLSGIARGTIHDIENPIAAECFDIRRRERGLTVFSAAVISQRKNTLALVDAFARVVAAGIDARLRLAGPVVEPSYGAMVDARIEALGLGDRVSRLGSIDAAGVRRELSSASVFGLVSLEENAPLGIEEAMAAGVPVVASNRCGMPYMVRHGETGYLVDPFNIDEIARRLLHVLEDPSRRRQMGDAARTSARERFHPASVARRTRDVYFEAAGFEPAHASDRPALEAQVS